MEKALKIQQQMALDKYESLNIVDQRRVLFHMDDLAKDKGYLHAQDLKDQRPYIWEQMCADTVTKLFP